ncbi:hypothetical protein C0Q70_00481 [Pomacea canaliculata]|uniref:Uncharacterized protein n=1 Tax=Pomacea canaliculata TaxID=400727 RepID=A0A2T7PWU1_POMCA|nr:hypothetical protein C0Q70_00481 [Pomacea canaliculata]
MTSCVDADVDDNIAFPVGTVICSRASTTTVPTIETSADSFEQVTTPEQILGTATGGSTQATERTTMTSTSVAAATTRAPCNVNLEQLSAVYNLDNIRQQCNEFHACTVELYKLMYRNNNNSSYRILEQQCSTQERESIKGLLEEKLSSVFDDPSEGEGTETWLKLKTCLDGAPDDDQYINKLCSSILTSEGADWRGLWRGADTHSPRHHHRSLRSTSKAPASSVRTAVSILIKFVARKTESKRSGNKTSPTDSSWLSNQGIRNHSQAPEARVMRDSPGINLPPRHRGYPSVTSHYQHPAPASPSDSNYIELLPDVACIYRQQGLPGDRGHGLVSNHPRDRPYDLAKNVAPSPATERRMRMECPSGRYDRPLETIDMKSMGKSKPQGGYNHLGLQRGTPEVGKRSQPLTRQVAESEDAGERNCSNEHSYFEVEPTDTTKQIAS